MATLMAYLQDCKFLDSTNKLHMTYATKNEIAILAKDIFVRLGLNQDEPQEQTDGTNSVPSEGTSTESNDPAPPPAKFSKKLDEKLKENKK